MKPDEHPLALDGDSRTILVEGHSLDLTHLQKVFWPRERLTKADLLQYYHRMAPYMLPYLLDRPQSLHRHPDGIEGGGFFQKDVTGKVPDWIKLFPYRVEGDKTERHFLVCTGEAALLYMVSQGCIEINPWSSRAHAPDFPDWCVLDLDPPGDAFGAVVEVARVIHRILEALDVPSYPKTTGATGMHIFIPLGGRYAYDRSRDLARRISTLVQRELPSTTTMDRALPRRDGKVYLDFLQNHAQATLAAVYSVRPRPGATVSMPVHWAEVKAGLSPQAFTLRNAADRVRETGDLFRPVLGKGIGLDDLIKRITTTFGDV